MPKPESRIASAWAAQKLPVAKPRPKKCKACGETFTPSRPLQVVCSVPCSWAHVAKQNAKDDARLTREAKAKLKTRADWTREAQAAFNRWVRLVKDAGLPCISCGTTADVQYAAGHYRTRGAASQHRFNPDNVFKQCNRNCNCAKSGNIIEMRKGMIERIGIERVEAVENDNTPAKYTIDDLKAIKAKYTALVKDMGIA